MVSKILHCYFITFSFNLLPFMNSILLTSIIVYIFSLVIVKGALKISTCINALAKSEVNKSISPICGKTNDFLESALFLFRIGFLLYQPIY